MVMPYTWFDTDAEVGMSPGGQCAAGYKLDIPGVKTGASCMWFNNYTMISGEPTIPEYMRTYWMDFGGVDWYKNNPWKSPGSADIFSPCGNAGGNPNGCPEGAPMGDGLDCPGGGFSYGPNAEDVSFPGVVTTEWAIGSSVEVAWGIKANHGGGYSYRLCKVPEAGVSGVTEECFQQGVLSFSGDQQWVQYGFDENMRTEFRANRTRVGTTPEGSQWTKNPIPACNTPDGGWFNPTPECPQGTQFPPPADGLYGYGEVSADGGAEATFKWNIV